MPIHFAYFLPIPVAVGENIYTEEITGSVEWSENRTIQGVVTIDADATLTIKKGVVIEFDGKSSRIDVFGTLSVEGMPEHPVFLKKKDADQGDFYTVRAISSGKIVVRNADISGGGSAEEVFVIGQRTFFQNARADWSYNGALGALAGGTLDIEGVYFHDNALAVHTGTSFSDTVKVWRSKFSDNGIDIANQSSQKKADIRYNWWGNENGPVLCVTECQDRPRVYEKIIGGVTVLDWAKSKDFKDPVIVIPGILGSWRFTNASDLVLDPIFGTYDELVKTLDENGYTKDKDLFLFPYEWRASNTITAKLLKTRIEEIKVAAKWPKVDIVAHSMGGLVAREYIEVLGGGENVDQLITLGTPHNGAPQSYLTWEGGEFYDPLFVREFIIKKIFEQEAEENGYSDIFSYVRGVPIKSVRELLPVYSYLRDKQTNEKRIYSDAYPKNGFIENLKMNSNNDKLTPVLFSNIIGKTKDDETISTFRVDGASIELLNDPEAAVLWGHGKPDGYDRLTGDRGFELGGGDGVVPTESAKSVTSDETIELESNHGSIPTDGAKTVVRILSGFDAISSGELVYPPTSLLLFMPFSPVDIQIISPSGKKMGKNFETGGVYSEIPGAFYTGSDTQNEFVTIPNPEQGEYRVVTEGTGNGTYRIEVTYIEENNEGKTKESTATLTGIAEIDTKNESSVEMDESGDVTVVDDQDVVPPVTIPSFVGTKGTNNWYTSTVTVTLTPTDNQGGGGIEKTVYSIDNGTTWNIYTQPFSIEKEGVTTLQFFSTDTEGNKEALQTVDIKIDTIAPEGRITFNPTTKKLEVTGKDNLPGNVSVVVIEQKKDLFLANEKMKKMRSWFDEWWRKNKKNLPDMLATITDEAGHITSITFEKNKDRNGRLFIQIRSIGYDGKESILTNAFAQYKWSIDRKDQYRIFATQVRTVTQRIESHYIPRKNETWIMERPRELTDDDFDDDSERRPVIKKLPGLVVSYLETQAGKVVVGY